MGLLESLAAPREPSRRCVRMENGDAGCLPSGDNLAVWKRAAPRNRMRETFTSGSVEGLVEQSPILPGHPAIVPADRPRVELGGDKENGREEAWNPA